MTRRVKVRDTETVIKIAKEMFGAAWREQLVALAANLEDMSPEVAKKLEAAAEAQKKRLQN